MDGLSQPKPGANGAFFVLGGLSPTKVLDGRSSLPKSRARRRGRDIKRAALRSCPGVVISFSTSLRTQVGTLWDGLCLKESPEIDLVANSSRSVLFHADVGGPAG